MSSQQLWLLSQDLHKIKPASIPVWKRRASQASIPTFWGRGESDFFRSLMPDRLITDLWMVL